MARLGAQPFDVGISVLPTQACARFVVCGRTAITRITPSGIWGRERFFPIPNIARLVGDIAGGVDEFFELTRCNFCFAHSKRISNGDLVWRPFEPNGFCDIVPIATLDDTSGWNNHHFGAGWAVFEYRAWFGQGISGERWICEGR